MKDTNRMLLEKFMHMMWSPMFEFLNWFSPKLLFLW
jgi:hypothetical protein